MKRTADYFLYPVKSIEDLSPAVAAAVEQRMPVSAIQKIVVIPPQDYPVARGKRFYGTIFDIHTTPRRVLVFSDDEVMLLEVETEDPLKINTLVIPFQCLFRIKLKVILLVASVNFSWVDRDHVETVTIGFNAVGERLIRQQIMRIRGILTNGIDTPALPEMAVSRQIPLKFRNYLNSSLLPGERIFSVIYQPFPKPDEWWKRSPVPNRLIALTNFSLIVLEEDHERWISEYGMITQSFPLQWLQSVSFDRMPSAEITTIEIQLGIGANDPVMTLQLPLQRANALLLDNSFDAMGVRNIA